MSHVNDCYDVLRCDSIETPMGPAFCLRIHRRDMEPMGFRELWNVFSELYPGRWAMQTFPPADQLLDQANKYHCWVLEEEPKSFNLMRG